MIESYSNNKGAEGSAPQGNTDCGVSWGAVLAGTAAAAAVSLALVILGSALGLSSVSPWSSPQTATSFTVKTSIWLIIMQWIASGLGGYLTGRLRIKWARLHTEEVLFRDTAHGFLTWAVATLLTAILLTSTVASILGTGAQATATIAAGAAANKPPSAAGPHGPLDDANGYYIDALLRPAVPTANAPVPETRAETTRILMQGTKNGALSDDDKAYLSKLVAARSGISEADASRRVDNTIAQLNADKEKAKQDAETARKLAMHVSLFIFLSLLIGAFIASAAAAIGGRQRDEF